MQVILRKATFRMITQRSSDQHVSSRQVAPTQCGRKLRSFPPSGLICRQWGLASARCALPASHERQPHKMRRRATEGGVGVWGVAHPRTGPLAPHWGRLGETPFQYKTATWTKQHKLPDERECPPADGARGLRTGVSGISIGCLPPPYFFPFSAPRE